MPARETASCGTTLAPSPCLLSSWASIADAASSSGPRPAMHSTGALAAPRLGQRSRLPAPAPSARAAVGSALLGAGRRGRPVIRLVRRGLDVVVVVEILDQAR